MPTSFSADADIDPHFIVIDAPEPQGAPTGFAGRHRLLFAAVSLAIGSGLVLTGCFAFTGRAQPIPRPPAKPVFVLEAERPWTASSRSDHKRSTPAPAPAAALARSQTAHSSPGFHLTFDDGPHPTHTPAILDWLKASHLHATFFLLGENAQRYPRLVQRIVAEGHQIGNHSWSHPQLSGMSQPAVRSQIQRAHDAIVKAGGKAPTLFRPPYGALTKAQKAWIEKEFGYTTLLWDIDTEDWKLGSTAAIAARIERGLKPGGPNIILAHDIHARILPALQRLHTRLVPPSANLTHLNAAPEFADIPGW